MIEIGHKRHQKQSDINMLRGNGKRVSGVGYDLLIVLGYKTPTKKKPVCIWGKLNILACLCYLGLMENRFDGT